MKNGLIINQWGNKKWYKDDLYHREDGPAVIKYFDSGEILCEEWFLNGKKHREDGPAVISYHRNGTIFTYYYYLNGKRLTQKEWKKHKLIKKLAGIK